MKVSLKALAIPILNEQNVKLIESSLQLSYWKPEPSNNSVFQKFYQIPIFVINPPQEYIKPKQTIFDSYESKQVNVELRYFQVKKSFKISLDEKIILLKLKARGLISEAKH